MVTSSAGVGTSPVDHSAATSQSPLTGFFQFMAAIASLPLAPKRLGAVYVEVCGLIVQNQRENGVWRPLTPGGSKLKPRAAHEIEMVGPPDKTTSRRHERRRN